MSGAGVTVGNILSAFYWCWVLLGSLNASAQNITVRSVLSDPQKQILVAAHRGDWKNYPENSIPAILSCIEKGIDIVEVDVQKTSDGHFILMHDQTLRRTTDGKGRVGKYTRAAITKLYLRDKNGVLTKYHVPTLDTVLALTRGKIILNIDKSSGHFPELLKLIEQYRCGQNVILKGSSTPAYFRSMTDEDRSGTTFMPIINGSYQNIDSFLSISRSPIIEVLLRTDTAMLCSTVGIKNVHERNCGIWYNALFASIAGGHVENDDAVGSWEWFIGHGARVIQTDYPFELMQFLIIKGFHPWPEGFKSVSLVQLPAKNRVVLNTSKDSSGKEIPMAPKFISPDTSFRMNSNEKKTEAIIVRNTASEKKIHTVRKNDTLSEIAERYHISMKKLLSMNPKLKKDSILQIGQKIRVG
ncbi:MAG: glycerophosphodiester phosphodiesterase family protein [Bacteroidota bacterium]